MSVKDELLTLAREICTDNSLNIVEGYLDDDDFDSAREGLLGALDCLVLEFGMPEDESVAKYKLIGFTPDQASKIRQNSGLLGM